MKADRFCEQARLKRSLCRQYDIDAIIYAMCACRGNLYAVMKEILRCAGNDSEACAQLPGLRLIPQVEKCAAMIDAAIERAALSTLPFSPGRRAGRRPCPAPGLCVERPAQEGS